MASDVRHAPEPSLLGPADPPPVTILNAAASSPFLLIGDHAGNQIPAALGTLGLGEADRARHIAWDIGVGALGAALAEEIGATFIRQTYSRLVVDCNRGPDSPNAIAPSSDGSPIAANRDLTPSARAARFAEIHEPYQAAIDRALEQREREGRPTVLVALHSFTPALADGAPRPWHAGILHDRGDTRFALRLLAALRGERDLVVGDNEPYAMDSIDYTVPRHAYPRALPYAEIEIRQDLLSDRAGVAAWSRRLARLLADSLEDGRP